METKVETPCSFGAACSLFIKGKPCGFKHDNSTDSSNLRKITIPCKFGEKCYSKNCKFIHPKDNMEVMAKIVDLISKAPSSFDNDVAQMEKSPQIHSNLSTKSPAFQKPISKVNQQEFIRPQEDPKYQMGGQFYQKIKIIEEFSFKCIEHIAQNTGVKQSLEQLKKRSNNALVHYEFKNGECKIGIDKNVVNWGQFQEEASQIMPFNVKYATKDVKYGELVQVIKEFTAKHHFKINHNKVFIASYSEWQKIKFYNQSSDDKDEDFLEFEIQKNGRLKNAQVLFFGQKAKNVEVNEIKNLFKEFLHSHYKSDHSIFEGCNEMSYMTRTPIYNYLKTSLQIDKVLKNICMTHSIKYDDRSRDIFATTTHQSFLQIRNQLKPLFKQISTQTFRLDSNIEVYKTELPGRTTLKKKTEDKFNVKISDVQCINDGSTFFTNVNNQVQRHSGWQNDVRQIPKQQNNQNLQNQNNQNLQNRHNAQRKEDYAIQLTGIEVEMAIKYIQKQLDDYRIEELYIPAIKPDEFEQAKMHAKAISLKYNVFISFKDQWTFIGKQSKNRLQDAITEFQRAIQDITIGRLINTKSMEIADAPNPILSKLMKGEINKIRQLENNFKVNIKITKENYIISGNADGIAKAFKELTILQQTFLAKMVNIQITQPDRIQAIQMKGVFDWQREYEVQITQLTEEEEIYQEIKQHPGIVDYQSALVEHITYQWSYEVFSYDKNYQQRQDLNTKWFDYDSQQNSEIEAHYQFSCQANYFSVPKRIIGDNNHVQNGNTYQVFGKNSDIKTWKQKNTKTGFERQLNRRTTKTMMPQNNFLNASQLITVAEERKEGQKVQLKKYFVKGLKEKVDLFLNELDRYFNDPDNHFLILTLKKYMKVVNFNLLNRMDVIALTKFDCNFERGYTLDQIKIIGLKCQDAYRYFENILDNTLHFDFPQSWEQIDQHILESQNLIIIPVAQGSSEWQAVENQFKVTMSQARILQIERIQNRKLWRNFKHAMEDTVDKWGKPATTLMLYHGTSKTDPKLIYDSDEGFNMLFSQVGLWGQAIYFAQNSSYSNAFCHTTPQKTSQMFFARVLVGNYISLPQNKTIKMPPLVTGDSQVKYHDSIKGIAGGSDVFMIYANKKAYPEYLITYTK